jgi:hypothetical protein
VNRPEVAELAAVLSARFGGNEVEVAGAAEGAEVTIERAGGLHRFRIDEDVESSPLLRYLLLGYVSPQSIYNLAHRGWETEAEQDTAPAGWRPDAQSQ